MNKHSKKYLKEVLFIGFHDAKYNNYAPEPHWDEYEANAYNEGYNYLIDNCVSSKVSDDSDMTITYDDLDFSDEFLDL